MPSIITLPPRAGSMRFTDAEVDEVLSLLAECRPGQAVRLTDKPDDSDNTARRRAQVMKEQIESRDGNVIASGWKLRGHVLTEGEPTIREHTSKKTRKKYKITSYPENYGAISLVPESEPDEPAPPDEENGGE